MVTTRRRGITVDAMLARARASLDRVPPERLRAEYEAGALVVDIRSAEDRAADGEFEFGVTIPRTVLEWRLAPSSRFRSLTVPPQQRVIVVCSDGYGSSLAAANLQELGLGKSTDLAGGFRGWLAHLAADLQHAGPSRS